MLQGNIYKTAASLETYINSGNDNIYLIYGLCEKISCHDSQNCEFYLTNNPLFLWTASLFGSHTDGKHRILSIYFLIL